LEIQPSSYGQDLEQAKYPTIRAGPQSARRYLIDAGISETFVYPLNGKAKNRPIPFALSRACHYLVRRHRRPRAISEQRRMEEKR
jgi:hypothetical protein